MMYLCVFCSSVGWLVGLVAVFCSLCDLNCAICIFKHFKRAKVYEKCGDTCTQHSNSNFLRVDVDADATNQDKNMHMYGDVKNKEG